MKPIDRLGLLAAALWWGSLTAVGAWVVPLLFAHLPTPALAGGMAAKLFAAQTWVALGCGLVLLMVSRPRGQAPRMDWAGGALAWLLAGLLAALVLEFGVAPRIVARQDLRLWHTVGSGLYLLQWACAGVVLWRPKPPKARAEDEDRKPGPRDIKVLKYSKRGGQRPEVRTLRVLGNQRLTPGGLRRYEIVAVRYV